MFPPACLPCLHCLLCLLCLFAPLPPVQLTTTFRAPAQLLSHLLVFIPASTAHSAAPAVNDDIQGTGAVVTSGCVNGMKLQKTDLADARVVFYGAGSSAVGVAEMIATYMEQVGAIVWRGLCGEDEAVAGGRRPGGRGGGGLSGACNGCCHLFWPPPCLSPACRPSHPRLPAFLPLCPCPCPCSCLACPADRGHHWGAGGQPSRMFVFWTLQADSLPAPAPALPALQTAGITGEQADSRIFMVDSKGLITTTRGDTLPEHKQRFARSDGTPDMKVGLLRLLGLLCLPRLLSLLCLSAAPAELPYCRACRA